MKNIPLPPTVHEPQKYTGPSADEVQTDFGRTGTHFWGFETQNVISDIVTMATGIGNGCPLAAVVTTHNALRPSDA